MRETFRPSCGFEGVPGRGRRVAARVVTRPQARRGRHDLLSGRGADVKAEAARAA